jgi:hypothetical protein
MRHGRAQCGEAFRHRPLLIPRAGWCAPNSKTCRFNVERPIEPALTFSTERDYFDDRLCSANFILGGEEDALVGLAKVPIGLR